MIIVGYLNKFSLAYFPLILWVSRPFILDHVHSFHKAFASSFIFVWSSLKIAFQIQRGVSVKYDMNLPSFCWYDDDETTKRKDNKSKHICNTCYLIIFPVISITSNTIGRSYQVILLKVSSLKQYYIMQLIVLYYCTPYVCI